MAKTNPALEEAGTQFGQWLAISNEKAKTVLGWHPRATASTIADTADSLITRGLLASN